MLIAVLVAFALQGLAWVWVSQGLRRVREAAPDDEGRPDEAADGLAISVVVAAHNEAERLPTLLDALAAQTHRPAEVIVVDDRSTDATAQRVQWRATD